MVEEIIGEIPDGWRYTTLGQVCVEGGGGIQTGPFGSQLHASDYVPSGIPTVMPTNIGDNRIVVDGIARILESDAKRLGRHRLQLGDIVYSRRGDVERRALVRTPEVGWLCGTGSLRVRVSHGADHEFISQWLGHPQVRAWITQHAVGATMANLNTEILSSVPVVLPPAGEQRAIAAVLGALDDKIEANRRLVQTVDSLVRAEWDVAHQLTATTTVSFGEVARRVNEPIDPTVVDGSVTYIGLEHMPRGLLILDEWGRAEGLGSGKSAFRHGDVLFGKLRPNFRKVGAAPVDGICSTDVLVLRPMGGYGFVTVLALASSDEVLGRAIAAASGTKMPRVSWEYLAWLDVELPDKSTLDSFEAELGPAVAAALHAARETVTVAALRDALLPELLSGRLRVRESEKVIEDVV